MNNNELYHYGILGMKWGVRRTQSQLGHTPTKKRGVSSKVKKQIKKRVSNKYSVGNKRNDNTIETEAQKKARIEAKKKEVLKSRSAKELYKNADLFTTQELQSAYNRLQLERNIQNLAPKEVSKGQQFVNKAIKTGRTINEVMDTGSKLYNNVAKVYNSLSDSGRNNPLPLIKGESKKQK